MVTDFGATADGTTDSKQGFANAWKKACQTPGGGVLVPAGKAFVLSGGEFVGPCKGKTKFQIDGTLIASNDPKLDRLDYWITFASVTRLTIFGKGVLNGNGASAWSRCGTSTSCAPRPTSLKIQGVRHATIQGITSVNSKMFHIVIYKSQHVRVRNVQIRAPQDSPNTDGIHVGSSSNVEILQSSIATGDDCVSLGDGSTNVDISGVACGPGHGISIGSLGKYEDEEDVRGITVKNCNLTNTQNGLRIKTWAPSLSSNVVSDITYDDITLNKVNNPIIIDQHYCPHGDCEKGGDSGVQIKGVRFINVRGSSATEVGVNVQCSKTKPCRDVEFSRLDLTLDGRRPAVARCSNVNYRFQGSTPSRCT
ncbi:polygalacturonase-like [Salvia miltiorrhiza]|uniref:polygalacturonase-like n=1 Tax=Salvia miltiorrhiza TaxID=226208 RepID=UPI0025ACB1FC|nr:polygalacturonase-like [Salvia miltiorrhiza]